MIASICTTNCWGSLGSWTSYIEGVIYTLTNILSCFKNEKKMKLCKLNSYRFYNSHADAVVGEAPSAAAVPTGGPVRTKVYNRKTKILFINVKWDCIRGGLSQKISSSSRATNQQWSSLAGDF